MAEKEEIRNEPVSDIKWIDKQSEREKVPSKYFLLPAERKFPYRNKDGSLNCNLVRAAIVRAAQHGYPAVEKKARAIYEKHCKKENESEKSLNEFKLSSSDILRASIMTGLSPLELLKSMNYSTEEILEAII